MGAQIYLDVSRLLSAGRRKTPSGIERVELAYVKQFAGVSGTRFVAFFLGKLNFIPNNFVSAYIAFLENTWISPGASRVTSPGPADTPPKPIARIVAIYVVPFFVCLSAFFLPPGRPGENAVYLNLSHENLDKPAAISRFKSRTGAKLLFFIHDLIPITHPEYVRPGQPEKHRLRMNTVAALADVVLVNSAVVREDFLAHINASRAHPPVHVVHLGVEPGVVPISDHHAEGAAPYFIMLATIEPRKNHLLLLNLWRQFVADSFTAPRLIVVGRRGWENEMVLDMLDRCEAISEFVEERPGVGDAELDRLMHGARALLMPSFAEGYGLPVAEALAAGTPVICSDLPALREIGGQVPEYINPLDSPAWARAILDYAQIASPRRAAQCERLRAWSAPRWDSHFEQVAAILADLTAHPAAQKSGKPLVAAAF